jgi:predicted regulator of Ras-like GTPase activity (Roadblock/LC7/MglB family)
MQEKLKELAESVPEVESIAIVDEEGLIVYRYDKAKATLDMEEVAVHVVTPVTRLIELMKDISGEKDSLEELVFFTTRYVVLVYRLVSDTYLVVVARRNPYYGRVRFKVRSKLWEINSVL